MSKFNRIHLVVLDSVGIEGTRCHNLSMWVPDGASDTPGHISKTVGYLKVPNMAKIGLEIPAKRLKDCTSWKQSNRI